MPDKPFTLEANGMRADITMTHDVAPNEEAIILLTIPGIRIPGMQTFAFDKQGIRNLEGFCRQILNAIEDQP